MRRDVLIIEEMIEAADQASAVISGVTLAALAKDRLRRDALLWLLVYRSANRAHHR